MDVIRLVSMLTIVFYHMVFALYLVGIRQLESIRFMFENSNIHIAKIGVGLFFMISGAGLMLSTKDKAKLDLKKYYKRRFFRILIPYYLVYILYLIVFMLLTGETLSGIYKQNPSPLSLIFTLLGVDTYLASFGVNTFSLGIGEWFLGALILMYVLFPLLRSALLKHKYISLAVSIVYFAVILITYPYMSYAGTVPGYVNFTCKIMEFFLGMFFITIIDQIPQWLALTVSTPVVIFFLVFPKYIPMNEELKILIVNICFFLFIFGLEKLFNKIPHVMKLVTFLCGYTYEFFLVHHVVINYMTVQHVGVPFSNTDVLILFLQETLVIVLMTLIVKGILALPKLLSKKAA